MKKWVSYLIGFAALVAGVSTSLAAAVTAEQLSNAGAIKVLAQRATLTPAQNGEYKLEINRTEINGMLLLHKDTGQVITSFDDAYIISMWKKTLYKAFPKPLNAVLSATGLPSVTVSLLGASVGDFIGSYVFKPVNDRAKLPTSQEELTNVTFTFSLKAGNG